MKNIDTIRTILDMIEKELEKDEKHKDMIEEIKKVATDEEMEREGIYHPYALAWKYNIEYEDPARPTVIERLCITARQMLKELY